MSKGSVTYIYDLFDRLVQIDEQSDINVIYTTTYTHDSDSHLVRTINPRGAKIKNSYDNLGRLIQTDYPAQDPNRLTSETFTYDNIGNLISKTGANGTKSIMYDFIGSDYLIKTVNEPGRTVSYTYDPNGNLLTQTCPGAVYTYSNYDARNCAHNFSTQIEGNAFSFSYNFDLYGRVTSITYPNRAQAISYSYDELDRLQSIPGFVTSYNYDGDSKLTDMLFGNGINNHYTYQSNDDKIANISVGPSGSLLNLNYSYDNNGNITKINNDYYSYDGLNRLKWAGDQPTRRTGNGTLWSYDSAGNMTGKESYINSVSQGAITASFDLAKRLLSMGGKTYTNDSAGNRTGKIDMDNWAYIYDGENRLKQVTKNSIPIPTTTPETARIISRPRLKVMPLTSVTIMISMAG